MRSANRFTGYVAAAILALAAGGCTKLVPCERGSDGCAPLIVEKDGDPKCMEDHELKNDQCVALCEADGETPVDGKCCKRGALNCKATLDGKCDNTNAPSRDGLCKGIMLDDPDDGGTGGTMSGGMMSGGGDCPEGMPNCKDEQTPLTPEVICGIPPTAQPAAPPYAPGFGPYTTNCDSDDADRACIDLCIRTCERRDWFCPGGGGCTNTMDDDGDGRTDESDEACVEIEVPDGGMPPAIVDGDGRILDGLKPSAHALEICGGDSVDALKEACKTLTELPCADMECPPAAGSTQNQMPRCGATQFCDNTCATPFDNVCNDGDPINQDDDSCERGTDCADCGPRVPLVEAGGECVANHQCAGWDKFELWCVNVRNSTSPLGRCVPACHVEACPDRYECNQLARENADIQDFACFPACDPIIAAEK